MFRALGMIIGVALLTQAIIAGDLTVQIGRGVSTDIGGVSPVVISGSWQPFQILNGVLRPEVEIGGWYDWRGQHYSCYAPPCINYDGWWGTLAGIKLAASNRDYSSRLKHLVWFEGGIGLLFQQGQAIGYRDAINHYDQWFGKRESNLRSQIFGRIGIKMSRQAAFVMEGTYLNLFGKKGTNHTFDYLLRIGVRWKPLG